MRIAIDGNALGSGRGGDETLLRGILRGLAEVRCDDDRYVVLLPDDTGLPPEVDGAAGVEVASVPRVAGLRRFAVTLPRRLAQLTPPVDAVLSLTHGPLTTRVTRVLLVTDISFHRHPEHYPAATRLRLNALVPRQAERSEAVVTISEFCRADLIDAYGLDPERVHVVPCAIDPPTPLAAEAEARLARWAATQGITGPFVLYLGNLHHRKNVPRLVLAFLEGRRDGALRDHQLVIAGARWWSNDGESATVASAPPGTIVQTGPVDDEQREWLLRHAAVLAYPSLFEGFGLPPLEAMARGTPVVASNTTSIPEVVGDAALLVDPLSVEDIADKLVVAATDAATRARLQAAGRERAAGFTIRRTGSAARAALAAAVGTPSTVVA